MSRTTVVALMAGGLLLAACGESDAPLTTGSTGRDAGGATTVTQARGPIPEGAEGLEEARRRWAAAGIVDYEMTYQELCFCPQAMVTVTVVDGEVTDTTLVAEDGMGWEVEGVTVEDLFDEIQQAIDTDAAEIQATYDPETGRPTRFWVDQEAAIADEEHGVEVTSFSPGRPIGPDDPTDPSSSAPTTGTTQAPSTVAVATAELTEMWGCGTGFHASDPQQTVALVLDTPGPAVAGEATVTLPSADWTAEVRVGSDLFANWCDDVIEPGEPTPEVDETWPVVGGTVQLSIPDGGCSGGVATATVTDLVVQAPDGGTVTLAPLTLINDTWGCYAG